MVPSGEYFDSEHGKDSNSGCGAVASFLFVCAFFCVLGALGPDGHKQRMKKTTEKEIVNGLDTCYKIKDSIRVYKVK